jgi:flagellar biosynthetic protein FliR
MLEALVGSLDRVPLGSLAHLRDGFGAILTFGSTLFALGLQFAAPILAIVMIVNVALAVLSRAAPQLNILALAFPIQILAGLLGLIGVVPLIGSWFLGWQGSYAELVTRALIAISGGR